MSDKNQNIGFIQFASSPVHFAGLLEIAHDQFLEGNSINFAIWGAHTHFPSRMSENFQSLSKKVPKKIIGVLNAAAPRNRVVKKFSFDAHWVSEMMSQLTPLVEKINSVEELHQLKIGKVNPGPAIANEFVTIKRTRQASPAMSVRLISKLLRSYLEVFNATQLLISKRHIDKLYLFNGRFLHERAAWDAGKQSQIQVIIFETTRNNLHIREQGFHNRVNNQKQILQHWEKSIDSTDRKMTISDEWFAGLRSNKNPFSTDNFKVINVPKPFIVYFSNSDDEAVGFWEYWSHSLGTQIECVKELIQIIESQNEISLVIRLHPNLTSKPRIDQEEWLHLTSSEKIIIFGAENTISSYGLIQQSQGVITFGSTIGIEAAYMCKPVMVMADCKYDELGFAFKPKSWAEVNDWIESSRHADENDLIQKRELSRKFGYFIYTGGQPFKYSRMVEIGWGAWKVQDFLGLNWEDPRIISLYRKLVLKLKSWINLRNELN